MLDGDNAVAAAADDDEDVGHRVGVAWVLVQDIDPSVAAYPGLAIGFVVTAGALRFSLIDGICRACWGPWRHSPDRPSLSNPDIP